MSSFDDLKFVSSHSLIDHLKNIQYLFYFLKHRVSVSNLLQRNVKLGFVFFKIIII